MQIQNSMLKRLITYINKYFGWRNWSVFYYNSVVENVFLIFYIALRNQLYTNEFIIDLFIFFAFSMFSTTYGYLINDYADIELDARQGKANTFKDDPVWKAGIIVVLFLILSIFAGTRFIEKPMFIAIWISWLIIATFYSLKPLRLKDRGATGLLFVVIAQRVLPTLLIFSAFNHFDWVDVSYFTLYIFSRGLSSDVNHQLDDYHRDITTGTGTFAIQAGIKKTQKIFRIVLEIENVMLMIVLFIMSWKLNTIRLWGVNVMYPILLGYMISCVIYIVRVIREKGLADINPFIHGRKDIVQFIHHAFPSVILPLYMLLILVHETRLFEFVCLTLLFVLYRKLYSIRAITNSYPIQILKNMMHRI